jgi:hypothetical protein
MATKRVWSRFRLGGLLLALAGVVMLTSSCGDGDDGELFIETRNIAVCDPGAGPFSLAVTNPFFPLPVGHELVLEGVEDEEEIELVITVLDQTEVVAGVTTRVVEERETVDGELAEVSRNFFAQAPDGTVCYFGEDVEIYEEGEVVSNEGQWRAGIGGARPGIIMPSNPVVGDAYRQEHAPGVAEDRARVTAVGKEVTVPAGTFSDTLTTFEDSPLEPGAGETKVYASGIGPIRDGVLRLTSFD